MSEKKSVVAKARSWAARKKLFGPQAFLRYVILNFTENVNKVSDDFIFKGGNLLWVYIATPRATIDLDFATKKSDSHAAVRDILGKACTYKSDIKYSIAAFNEIKQDGKSGASIKIAYETNEGASNTFEVDIVYALDTDTQNIPSPVNAEVSIRSATIENIISDKLSACHRFKSGNTRMKDFDDLWRISQSNATIEAAKLLKLVKANKTPLHLDASWIDPNMERTWRAHQKRYQDLPKDLAALFDDVNAWLQSLQK